ncbi:hypothetical protein F652_369 [Enterobacteriaceae bacterium bta3-1]|nr:hypothetical protein F652_369 [Enterobacteriaceae bacterium bta3-1]
MLSGIDKRLPLFGLALIVHIPTFPWCNSSLLAPTLKEHNP